jgi:hypothetical protein
VFAILGHPKYTGHMVYGRQRRRNGRRVAVEDLFEPAVVPLIHPQAPIHPGNLSRAGA